MSDEPNVTRTPDFTGELDQEAPLYGLADVTPVHVEDMGDDDSLQDIDTVSGEEQEALRARAEEKPEAYAEQEVYPITGPDSIVPAADPMERTLPLTSTVAPLLVDPPVEKTTTEKKAAAEAAEPETEGEKPAATPRCTLDMGLFIARVVLGVVMALHGADKLFGLFGGSISQMETLLRSVGFTNHTELLAILAGVTELVGGIIVILGLFAPMAAAGLLGVLGTATLTHIALGQTAYFAAKGGALEFILVLVALASVVILAGSGKWAIDGQWGWAVRPEWGAVVWWIVGLASGPILWAVLNTQGFPF